MRLKTTRTQFHTIVETPNGASYSIPTEVIKGIILGEIDDSKYYDAIDFLSGEELAEVSVEEVRKAYEDGL